MRDEDDPKGNGALRVIIYQGVENSTFLDIADIISHVFKVVCQRHNIHALILLADILDESGGSEDGAEAGLGSQAENNDAGAYLHHKNEPRPFYPLILRIFLSYSAVCLSCHTYSGESCLISTLALGLGCYRPAMRRVLPPRLQGASWHLRTSQRGP